MSECNRQQNACQSDRNIVRQGRGNPGQCTFECDESPRQCGLADGQCSDNCLVDPDCERCGNGRKEGAEICDGNCPNSCPNMGCQLRRLSGSPSTCDAVCVDAGTQTACRSNDNCCPTSCNASNDNDCNPRCGNGVKEGNEVCDGNCPTNCPAQGCTKRRLQNPNTCRAQCVNDGQVSCGAGAHCDPDSGDCVQDCGKLGQPCCPGSNATIDDREKRCSDVDAVCEFDASGSNLACRHCGEAGEPCCIRRIGNSVEQFCPILLCFSSAMVDETRVLKKCVE